MRYGRACRCAVIKCDPWDVRYGRVARSERVTFGGVVCVGGMGFLDRRVIRVAFSSVVGAGDEVWARGAASRGVGGFVDSDDGVEMLSWCRVRCWWRLVVSLVVLLPVVDEGVFRTLKASRSAERENILEIGAGRLPALVSIGSPGRSSDREELREEG